MQKKILVVAMSVGLLFLAGTPITSAQESSKCKDGVCSYSSDVVYYGAGQQDIGIEQAKAIAFQHAGVTEDQVRMKKVKMDYEHGVKIYEVEFYVGFTEYEYDIKADTGEILKFSKE